MRGGGEEREKRKKLSCARDMAGTTPESVAKIERDMDTRLNLERRSTGLAELMSEADANELQFQSE